MLYRLKRHLLFQIKNLETFFVTRKKHREIAKAYHAEQRRLHVVLTRGMIAWAGIIAISIGIITAGVVYSGSILRSVRSIQEVWQNNIQNQARERKQREEKKAAGVREKTRIQQQQHAQTTPIEKTVMKDTLPAIQAAVEPEPSSIELDKMALPFPRDMQFCILTNKNTKTLYVLRKQTTGWAVFLRYGIAIGEQKGQKARAGDKKTPEGLYFIIGRKEKTELPIMYGPLAFVLNYPNAEDRKNNRTGNGIWIHGTNPDSLPDRTRGCLELNNPDISQLGTYLKTGIGTPVIITYTDTIIDPVSFPDFQLIEAERQEIINEYVKNRNQFTVIVEQWKKSWEMRDIDAYARFYNHEIFYGQGMSWNAYKEHKARTFLLYDTIRITLDKIYLSELSETTAVLKFLQGYQSDRLQATNGKKLHFIKDKGAWKIYRESTMSNEELLL